MAERALALLLVVGACGDPLDVGGPDAGGTDPPPLTGDPPPATKACPSIYAQDRLPTFAIEIAEADWQALHDDAVNGVAREEAGQDPNPYRPLVSFRHEDAVTREAAIRLRGNPLWWSPGKLQFQISFNETNRDGRFLGLRKIVLDAAPGNQSFLRDRLALAILRDLGVATPCGNNARLVVNGTYYGLYQNIEKIDREFLERVYGKRSADGDLWKRKGWELKTNEATATRARLDMAIAARDPERICALVDCQAALLEWAGEAMLPDADGAWVGALNYYLYDHPSHGFVYLPWDLDATFTRLPADVDPLRYVKAGREAGRPHYDALVADPTWRGRYLDALAAALAEYEVGRLRGRIDEWSEQIREAASQDRNKPFTTERHRAAVREMHTYVGERAAFVEAWLAAER